ncbi:MAG: lipoate--protein ligase family protein, partial [Chlamydiia bacterium]|nr:lipoate--protein ligase family protein [Chlamydiia bacterium]
LRVGEQNVCLINRGAPPAVVLGISAKTQELINIEQAKNQNIPLIKRFSGGGTVYIDENTLFVTFIWEKKSLEIPFFPHAMMEWSEKLYRPLFGEASFALQENDYVIGEKKVGGNAQYIQKERFLHHTSFLWEFDPNRMNVLKVPPKQPKYRQKRSHKDFLMGISSYFRDPEAFFEALMNRLSQLFTMETLSYEKALELTYLPHRKSTEKLE